ncbi:MAG: SDR family oxidoreductase [Cyclobacteriaceae bacterium]|nr:SDR family oxidoreductase [Cyclobacteriaceae bacterium]
MMDMFFGKRILITGASKGIGFALAQKLDELGAKLLLHASSSDGISRIKEVFEHRGHSIWQSNFAHPECLETSLEEKLEQFGSLDGYVNCVGMRVRRPINLLKVEIMREAFNINVIAYLEVVRVISKRKYYNPGLSILSISSISAHAGSSGISVYAATKGAIESATKNLAHELHKKGIRINTLVSGQVNTEAYLSLMEMKEQNYDPILERQYLGLIDVNEMVEACLFLLNDRSKVMSGISFPMDAGYLS